MQRAVGGGVAVPNLGSPKMRGKCSPPHTHTLPWLWLCATLIDVPAKPALPCHATPPPRLTAAVYMSMAVTVSLLLPGCNWHRFPHQSNSSRAAEAAAAAKMLQQDDSSTWAKKLPQFSNYSQNFMPTKATHSMHRQPQGSVPHTHRWLLWGAKFYATFLGCHCQQLLQPKRICAAVQHIQIQPAMCMCVFCMRVCVCEF